MDTKGIKGILRIAYPNIKYIKKYLFKRTEPLIALNIINQLTENIKNFKENKFLIIMLLIFLIKILIKLLIVI